MALSTGRVGLLQASLLVAVAATAVVRPETLQGPEKTFSAVAHELALANQHRGIAQLAVVHEAPVRHTDRLLRREQTHRVQPKQHGQELHVNQHRHVQPAPPGINKNSTAAEGALALSTLPPVEAVVIGSTTAGNYNYDRYRHPRTTYPPPRLSWTPAPVGWGRKVRNASAGRKSSSRLARVVLPPVAPAPEPIPPPEEDEGNLTYEVEEDVTVQGAITGDDTLDENGGVSVNSSADLAKVSKGNLLPDELIKAASHNMTLRTKVQPPPVVYDANGDVVKLDWSKWSAYTSTTGQPSQQGASGLFGRQASSAAGYSEGLEPGGASGTAGSAEGLEPGFVLSQVSTTEGIEREESSFGSTTEGSARAAPERLVGAFRMNAMRKVTTTPPMPDGTGDETSKKPVNLAEPAAEAEATAIDAVLAGKQEDQATGELNGAFDRLQGEDTKEDDEVGGDEDDRKPNLRPE